MSVRITIEYRCDGCDAKNEVEVVMDDAPERRSWDYPGSGATYHFEGDLKCSQCHHVNDEGQIDSLHGDLIQEKIAEYLGDMEPDYPED